MNGHPQSDEDLSLYSLGVLEGEEKQALELHLRACTDCARKLSEARGRMALLALAAPPRVPSPRAKKGLLRSLRIEPTQHVPARSIAFQGWLVPALALTSLALAIGLELSRFQVRKLVSEESGLQHSIQVAEADNTRLRTIEDLLKAPDTVKVTLVSGAALPIPQGKAFYHPRKGLLFYAANLPPLTPHRTYQLWLVPVEGNPISAGVFQVDSKGNGEIVLPALPSGVTAKAFAVTVEPAGGVPQPTGPKVLIGAVS